MLLPRLFGALLLLATYLPIHRLLDPEATGPAGAATRAAAEAAWAMGLSGTLIVVTLAWVCIRVLPADQAGAGRFRPVLDRIQAQKSVGFALSVGALATSLACGIAWRVYGGMPTSVDEMAQLFHASALRGGRLTIPLVGSDAAWVIQNGVITSEGWASIYPPVHTILLAIGLFVGAAWIVGPIAIGVATALTTLSAEILLGATVGRVTGLLLAVCPFWLLLGSTHLSHATSAAALSLVLWTGLRARDGGTGWALGVGLSVGAAVGARPWTGLVCSGAILATLWLSKEVRSSTRSGGWVRRLGAVALGGLPFALLLFSWNARLFGHPLRLGYLEAFGPSHGLGFGVDPWGNRYGILEALAYTSADLGQLGGRLLESPLPALALVGAVLVTRPFLKGAWVFLAWALAAVVANTVYWHHGIHMGPRMLFESTPAWIALLAVAATLIFNERERSTPSTVQRLAMWSLALTLLGSLGLAPLAVRANAGRAVSSPLPAPAADTSIVFVHGSWASRVSARLLASGMRRDSIETALRRNDICAVDAYARWRSAGDASLPPPSALDFAPRAGSPTTLQTRALSPGNLVRVSPDATPDAACIREARADRMGVLELELLAWRSPPFTEGTMLLARDLGPAGNARILHELNRKAYLFIDSDPASGPTLLDYADGMELLWGGAAGDTEER
jgi:hypothetical protein